MQHFHESLPLSLVGVKEDDEREEDKVDPNASGVHDRCGKNYFTLYIARQIIVK